MNLNGIFTNSDQPDYPESRWRLIEPHIPKDLTGKTVLDLGCNAGFFSIKMKERGADYVLGIDVLPLAINQAKFIAEFFDVDIVYELMNVYEFVLKNKQKFDFVIFLGLFYHLRYPLLVLDKVSEITKEKLYFQSLIRGTPSIAENNPALLFKCRQLKLADDYEIIETKIFEHPDYPKMFFVENKYNHDNTNWWFCNETCIYAMLRSAGFKNIMKSGADIFICDPPSAELMTGLDYATSRVPTLEEILGR